MPGRLRMSYDSASSVKSKWSTSSFSGGMGGIVYKNLGKPGIPNRFDQPCNANTPRNRCYSACAPWWAGYDRNRRCCDNCGGRWMSRGGVSWCAGLTDGICTVLLL